MHKMEQSLIEKLVEMTGQSEDAINDAMAEMPLEELYTLVDLVSRDREIEARAALKPFLKTSDNSESDVTEAMKKKSDIPTIKPKNPHAAVLNKGLYKPQTVPDKSKDRNQRSMKHKGRSFDEAFDLTPEDDVSVEETMKKVNEGVMGMTPMKDLRRMMELAGVTAPALDAPVPGDEMAPEVDPTLDPAAPVDVAPEMDDGMDMDAEMGMGDMGDDLGGDMGVDPMAAGGDLGMDPMGGVANSPAYTMIEDALNSIQANLPDVKVSEYKGLMQRLEDLAAQLSQVGKSYLGD